MTYAGIGKIVALPDEVVAVNVNKKDKGKEGALSLVLRKSRFHKKYCCKNCEWKNNYYREQEN